MTKHKKRKAHTRAVAKERGVSYRTALHQEQGGGQLPPDFRLEMELKSFPGRPPHGLRLRVPGAEAVSWLDHPRDAARVMDQVSERIPKEFPKFLKDFILWMQLRELPEDDMFDETREWAIIDFHDAYSAIEEVLLSAMEHVGWGAWGENTPSSLVDNPTLEIIFEMIEEVFTRDATDAQKAALTTFFRRACETATQLDVEATAASLKEADTRLRALGWQPPFGWEEDEEDWEDDNDAYSGPEAFTMQGRGSIHVFFEGEVPGGLVLRNGDEYVVKAQGRVKLNDGRRCVLLTHGALGGGTAVRVRFLDTQEVTRMDATDLVWSAREP